MQPFNKNKIKKKTLNRQCWIPFLKQSTIVIFYTEILTRKVVLWSFFKSETSEKSHNSIFWVSIECNFFKWVGKYHRYLSQQWCIFLVKRNSEPIYFLGSLETMFDGYHPHNPQKFPLEEEVADLRIVYILENVFWLEHKNIFQYLN